MVPEVTIGSLPDRSFTAGELHNETLEKRITEEPQEDIAVAVVLENKI